MKEYFLKVMPDYYSSGLWDQNDKGVMTTLSDHIPATPGVVALEQDILNWNNKYDRYVRQDRPSPDFDWENFHKEGLELFKVSQTLSPASLPPSPSSRNTPG